MSEAVHEPGLFPEPVRLIPAAPQELTRGQREQRKVARRIVSGKHPLGYVPLHPQAIRNPEQREGGPRCGGCAHRATIDHNTKGYPKCMKPTTYGDVVTYPRATASETSDIRAWWPACYDFLDKETDEGRRAIMRLRGEDV